MKYNVHADVDQFVPLMTQLRQFTEIDIMISREDDEYDILFMVHGISTAGQLLSMATILDDIERRLDVRIETIPTSSDEAWGLLDGELLP